MTRDLYVYLFLVSTSCVQQHMVNVFCSGHYSIMNSQMIRPSNRYCSNRPGFCQGFLEILRDMLGDANPPLGTQIFGLKLRPFFMVSCLRSSLFYH